MLKLLCLELEEEPACLACCLPATTAAAAATPPTDRLPLLPAQALAWAAALLLLACCACGAVGQPVVKRVGTPEELLAALREAASGPGATDTTVELTSDVALTPAEVEAFAPPPFRLQSGRSLVLRGGERALRWLAQRSVWAGLLVAAHSWASRQYQPPAALLARLTLRTSPTTNNPAADGEFRSLDFGGRDPAMPLRLLYMETNSTLTLQGLNLTGSTSPQKGRDSEATQIEARPCRLLQAAC